MGASSSFLLPPLFHPMAPKRASYRSHRQSGPPRLAKVVKPRAGKNKVDKAKATRMTASTSCKTAKKSAKCVKGRADKAGSAPSSRPRPRRTMSSSCQGNAVQGLSSGVAREYVSWPGGGGLPAGFPMPVWAAVHHLLRSAPTVPVDHRPVEANGEPTPGRVQSSSEGSPSLPSEVPGYRRGQGEKLNAAACAPSKYSGTSPSGKPVQVPPIPEQPDRRRSPRYSGRALDQLLCFRRTRVCSGAEGWTPPRGCDL